MEPRLNGYGLSCKIPIVSSGRNIQKDDFQSKHEQNLRNRIKYVLIGIAGVAVASYFTLQIYSYFQHNSVGKPESRVKSYELDLSPRERDFHPDDEIPKNSHDLTIDAFFAPYSGFRATPKKDPGMI